MHWPAPAAHRRPRRCWPLLRPSARTVTRFSLRMRGTWQAAQTRNLSGALLDRLALDAKRVEAMAAGIEAVAELPDPVGYGHRRMDPSERPAHPARSRAARRDRHHLREPAERHRRCGRAVPEVRQCRDPARRLRELSLQSLRSTRRSSLACVPAGCRRRPSRWCRPRTAMRSATCWRTCRNSSMSSCPAAARA